MHKTSDFSAIVIQEPPGELVIPTVKPRKYKFEINIGIMKPQLSVEKDSITEDLRHDIKAVEDNFIVKKRKLSDSDFKIIQSEGSKSQKIVLNMYSKVAMSTIKDEQKLVVDDAMLINAFTKGIIRYAMKEISKEIDTIGSEQYQLFRSFAFRHFGKVNDSEGMKGIWTVEEFDSDEVISCKHLFLKYSLQFFSDEKIILDWIDIPEVKDIVRKVYTENRDTFQKSFLDPLLGYADITKA